MMPIEHLANLVKARAPCTIQMRSCPETILEGTIEGFDVQTVPSMLVVNNSKTRRTVNMEDISIIAEKPR